MLKHYHNYDLESLIMILISILYFFSHFIIFGKKKLMTRKTHSNVYDLGWLMNLFRFN